MITQIYSIQTAQEALACIDAGADRIGLLVGVHGGKFPCAITQEKAKERPSLGHTHSLENT